MYNIKKLTFFKLVVGIGENPAPEEHKYTLTLTII